jgi:pilus assembly protein Flp/PilA
MRGTGTMFSIWRFLRDEDGPTAVEYAVMLALIILTAMSGIAAVGNTALFMWNDLIKTGLNSTP